MSSLSKLPFTKPTLLTALGSTALISRPRILRYGIAVLIVAVALGISLIDRRLFEPNPFLLLWPAVAFGAWYGGVGPGMVCAIIASLGINYFFQSNHYQISLDTINLIRLVVFLVIALLISSLHEASKQTEALLYREREWFQTTLSSIGDGMIATDVDGSVILINAVAAMLTGWRQEEAIGKPITDILRIVNEFTRQPVANPVWKVLQTGRVVGLANHTVLIGQDGIERPVEDSAAPIRDVAGQMIGVVFVFRDVSVQSQMNKALTGANEQLKSVLESITDAYYVLDYEFRIVEANLVAEQTLFQCSIEELQGRVLWDVYPKAVGDEFYQQYQRATEERKPIHFEGYSHIAWKWFDAHVYPRANRIEVYLRDIDARKQAEEALRQSEERFRVALKNSPILVGTQDRELRYTWIHNPEHGVTPEQIIGKRDEELTPVEDVRELVAFKQAVLNSGIGNRQEIPIKVNGKTYYYDVTAEPLRGLENELLGVTIASMNITERHEAQERIIRLQSVTSALLKALTPNEVAQIIASQGAAMFGATTGTLALLDDAGKMLTVVGSDVFFGPGAKDPWFTLPIESSVPTAEVARCCIPIWIESPQSWIVRYPHLAGELDTGDHKAWAIVPLMFEDHVLGVMSLMYAVPHTFKPEDREFILALAQQCAQAVQRARLYEAAQQAHAGAEEAVQLRNAFLSIAAHELKTPLTAMLGNIQLVHRHIQQGKGDTLQNIQLLKRVNDQTSRLSEMIETLLDLSHLEQGQLTLDRVSFDLRDLLRRIISEIEPGLTHHTLRCTMPPEAVIVDGDMLRLQQVFQNLIQNAIKYSPQGGQITIGVEREQGSTCSVSVHDKGIGIPAEALPKLFQRFYRATNIAGIKGIGIGLYVVKEIVKLHGGTIQVASIEGAGSTFTVSLPCSE